MCRNKYRKILSLVMALMVTVSMQPVNLAMAQENSGEVSVEATEETDAETEIESDAAAEMDTESVPDSDTSPDTESNADAEQMTEEADAETEIESDATAEMDTESVPDSDTSPDTESNTDAEQTTEESTAEAEMESNVLTVAGIASASVISVSVTWGAMAFTYTDSEQKWDPDTHTYETVEGGWVADETDGGKVTVENDGDVDITVNYSFVLNTENPATAELSGTFAADSSGTELTESSPVLSTDETTTAWLVLSGKLTEDITASVIGSVTVTITEVNTE